MHRITEAVAAGPKDAGNGAGPAPRADPPPAGAGAPPEEAGPSLVEATEATLGRLIAASRDRAAIRQRGPEPVWRRSMHAWMARAIIIIFGVVALGSGVMMAFGLLAFAEAAIILMPVAMLASLTAGLVFGAPESERHPPSP